MHRRMTEPNFRQEQQDGLRLPHVRALNKFVDDLQDRDGRGWLPYIAPLYGGVQAKMLNILRDPGRMTNSASGGSGYLCVENDDDSAERLADLLDEAGIAFDRTVPWNAYPWYINRKPLAAEIDAGVDPLLGLIELLPRLRVVMLNGGEAQDVWKRLKKRPGIRPDVRVIPTYHTGKQAFIGSPEVRAERMAHLRAAFAQAAAELGR